MTRSNSYDDESDDSFDSSRAARPILTATPLEPYVGGLISAALVVLTAVVTLVTSVIS